MAFDGWVDIDLWFPAVSEATPWDGTPRREERTVAIKYAWQKGVEVIAIESGLMDHERVLVVRLERIPSVWSDPKINLGRPSFMYLPQDLRAISRVAVADETADFIRAVKGYCDNKGYAPVSLL